MSLMERLMKKINEALMLKKSAKRALMFISLESCDEKALF